MTAAPTTDAYLTVRPQIVFFQQNYFDELSSIFTYVADTIYTVQSFLNPSVRVSTLHIYDTPLLYRDQQLQEFLDREECCYNFINQDLTFLQPSSVYQMTHVDDNQSTASDSTDASTLTVIENNQSQEVDSTPAFTSVTTLPEDFVSTDCNHIPIQSVEPSLIQPVEPVIGLNAEQRCREEDPNLNINELLGLSSCEDHVTTPLQTLDG